MDIEDLLTALGGQENIRTVEGALTRVRVGVYAREFIDAQAIRNLGAHGVVIQKDGVQLILGENAEEVSAQLGQRMPRDVNL